MIDRAALRACARIAWRQARRAPGRSALVVTMVALPIAALTLGATVMRTAKPTLDEYVTGSMGTAELQINPVGGQDIDIRALTDSLPAGTKIVPLRQWNKTEIVDGTLVNASVWEPSITIDRPPIPGLYEMIEGRAPTARGEAAVDPHILEVYGVEIGDEVVVGGRPFAVVGVAARPLQMWEPLVVVAPDTLPPVDANDPFGAFNNSILVDLPDGADVAAAESAVAGHLVGGVIASGTEDPIEAQGYAHEAVVTRTEAEGTFLNDAPVLTGVSFAGTALALFATGLIAAAAFAVGIRRQLRMLGLIGATGGEPSHVRAVVLLGGTTLGSLGAGIGIVVGLAGAYAIAPHLPRFIHALPGSVTVHLPTIVGAVLLGALAATAAAAWPARMAIRISTLDSMAARMPLPRPPGRLARRGLIVSGIGAAMTVAGFSQGNDVLPAGGLVLIVVGFLVSVPLLMTVSGRAAPVMPTAARLAVRDTARYGRRTGTAIAAAAMALMVPVGVAALSLSEEAYQVRRASLGADHLVIGAFSGDAVEAAFTSDRVVAQLRANLPEAIVVRLRHAVFDPAVHPPVEDGWSPREPALIARQVSYFTDPDGARSFGYEGSSLLVGGADLLRALHAEDGIPALNAGKVVGIGPGSVTDGRVQLRMPAQGSKEAPFRELPGVAAGSTTYVNSAVAPSYVISERGARAYGLIPGWAPMYGPAHDVLVSTIQPASDAQIETIKEIVAGDPRLFVQTRDDFLPNFETARLASTAAAVVIAFAIVGVTVALLSAEARRDQAILVAVGAGPGRRRRIAGARAALVALLASVIAVPAGFAPIAVMQASRPEGFPIIVPWSTMALVLCAVPMISWGFGWLASRAPKTAALLQPIA